MRCRCAKVLCSVCFYVHCTQRTLRTSGSADNPQCIEINSSISSDARVCFFHYCAMQPPVLREVILVHVSYAAVQDAVRSGQPGLLLERPSRKCQVSIVFVLEYYVETCGNTVDVEREPCLSCLGTCTGKKIIPLRCARKDGAACRRPLACGPPLR